MVLDENIEEILKEENPTAKAVTSLIEVRPKKKGEDSEIELKTDLTSDEVKLHTIIDILNEVLEMDEKDFSKKCILSSLINKKERKSLSKNRLSRSEIVAVAKQPEFPNDFGGEVKKQGIIRRFFTSKKENV